LAALVKKEDGAEMLYLGVRDTGIGIPTDKLGGLFQSFSQVDSSTSRRFGGTGLGLAISKRLTELMGGRIWATSQPDLGSVFQLEIPYRAATAQTAPSEVTPFDVTREWNGKRVLLVNDNETNRLSIVSYLTSWKLISRAVSSPRAALEAMRAERWDTVLLDERLPEMDGVDLAALVKREFGIDAPPIILLTASNVPKKDASGKETDLIAAAVTKPVRRRQLQRVLNQVLNGISVKQMAPSAKIFDSEFAKRVPLRILLAEDNPVNQKVAIRMLERMGYRLDAVGNGLEVLDALRRQTYDIVLMDVQMPEMNGLDATRQIISLWGVERPWITALTAGAMKENRDECRDAGVDDFLTKPINVQEVEGALQRCFHKLVETKNKKAGAATLAAVEVKVKLPVTLRH
jgi:CheY-like chemotaxis protein